MKVYVLFGGSRDLILGVDYSWSQVERALDELEPDGFRHDETDWWRCAKLKVRVCHGGARGPDTQLTEEFSEYIRYVEEPYVLEPDWSKGRHAGFIRNEELVQWLNAQVVCGYPNKVYGCAVVVWDGISSGTKDTIDHLKNYRVPHKVILVPRKPSNQLVLFP